MVDIALYLTMEHTCTDYISVTSRASQPINSRNTRFRVPVSTRKTKSISFFFFLPLLHYIVAGESRDYRLIT